MHEKDIIGWAMLKDSIDQKGRSVYCRAREVWWVSIGHNVGHEIDGKSERYTRPAGHCGA